MLGGRHFILGQLHYWKPVSVPLFLLSGGTTDCHPTHILRQNQVTVSSTTALDGGKEVERKAVTASLPLEAEVMVSVHGQ